MKKVIKIILIILLILALGTAGFFGFKYYQSINQPPIESGDIDVEEVSLAKQAVVRTIEIKEDAKSTNRYIYAKYPSIQSFKNKNFQTFVNDQITSVILSYKNEIIAMIDDKTPTVALYSYVTSYDKYTHGDYLSLVISNDYQTGGIRSNKWKDIYNIDVRKERIFYLKDIFPANINFEKYILDEIKSQATANNYELMNGAGLNNLDEKQKFFIKDEKLVIYFDPSEIAPTSYGELQFEMPFTLDEEGLFNI